MKEFLKKFQATEALVKKPVIAHITEKDSTSKLKGNKKQKKVHK